jgi:hypothetical protein
MVMVFNASYQLCRGSQFYWWRKSEYAKKTTDLPQVTDKPVLVVEEAGEKH